MARRPVFDAVRALSTINVALRNLRCRKLLTLGDTFSDPLITEILSIRPFGGKIEARFRVLFPTDTSKSVLDAHAVGEVMIYFSPQGALPNGAIVKALEAGQFLLADGAIVTDDDGWLIDWKFP